MKAVYLDLWWASHEALSEIRFSTIDLHELFVQIHDTSKALD
jgi:hypothetical protein